METQNTLSRRAIVANKYRSPIQKADLALSDLTGGDQPGYLTAQNAKQFMLIMIKESRFLQDITVVPMASHTYNIDKLRFANDVLNVGVEAQELSLGDRSTPTLSRSSIVAKPYKAEVRLDDFVLEDSIEGPGLANTVRTALAKAIARDMERIVLQSDTASATAVLSQFDGVFKKATSNVFDALDTNLNKGILREMVRLMPVEFLSDRSKLVFYTSIDADIDYRDAYANRQTVDGDSFLADYKPVFYTGIPIKAVPIFPENVGTSNHCTNVMLLDPKNAFLGIWRRLRLETDKNISKGVVSIVASMRFGFNFAEETAVVKASNVKVVSS